MVTETANRPRRPAVGLTREEVAKLLCVSVRTVTRLAKAGVIPCTRPLGPLGRLGKFRYNEEEIVRFSQTPWHKERTDLRGRHPRVPKTRKSKL